MRGRNPPAAAPGEEKFGEAPGIPTIRVEGIPAIGPESRAISWPGLQRDALSLTLLSASR